MTRTVYGVHLHDLVVDSTRFYYSGTVVMTEHAWQGMRPIPNSCWFRWNRHKLTSLSLGWNETDTVNYNIYTMVSLWIKSRGSDLPFYMSLCWNYWSLATVFDNAITTCLFKSFMWEKLASLGWNEQGRSPRVIGCEINQHSHPVCFDL